MDTKEQITIKPGRPPLYNDPVDVQVRMERTLRDWIMEQYPNVSISRAISLFIANCDEVIASGILE